MADSALGTTIRWLGDLDPMFALVSGRAALAQEIANRLITPRGSYLPDPEAGYDVRAFLNASMSPREIFQIASGIENEALKDERINDADATVTYSQAASRITIELRLTDDDGPFDLVVDISQSGLETVIAEGTVLL